MDKVRKPNISESYTPSSESYSNYFSFPLPIIVSSVIHTSFSLGAGIAGQFETIIQLLLFASTSKIIGTQGNAEFVRRCVQQWKKDEEQ
jgi:hypothetical protein